MKTRTLSDFLASWVYGGMLGLFAAIAANSQAIWVEQGPGPDIVPDYLGYSQVSGAVQAIAADPFNPDRVFIGSPSGGIWLTMNGTTPNPTWTPLTDQAASLSIQCLAISTLDASHNTVFAGIGRTSSNPTLNGVNGGLQVGVLMTIDGGNSWSLLGSNVFYGYPITRVLPSLTSPQTVFVTARNGLFRSDDGGQTWNQKSGTNGLPNSADFVDIVQDQGNPQRLFAAIQYPQPQLFRSTDLGEHWTDLTGNLGLANNGPAPARLTMSGVADSTGAYWVYFLVNNGSGPVYSKDAGTSWTAMDPLPSGSDPYHVELVASPTAVNIVFAQANWDHGMYRGDANASSPQWYGVNGPNAGNTNPHTDSRAWVFSANPNIMYESDDGGIYRLMNPFSNSPVWESAIGNLRVTEFTSVAYDSVHHIIFGACPDNSIPQQTIPGSTNWGANEAFADDGFQAGVDNTSTPGVSVHYSSQQLLYQFHRRFYTSPTTVTTDVSSTPIINGTGGLGYNVVEGNLVPGGAYPGTVRWNQTWAVNTVNGARLLMGTDYLYESFDRANTFTSLGGIGQNASANPIPLAAVGQVTAYAYGSPEDANVFYVGTTGTGTLGSVPRHLLWLRSSGTGYPTPIDNYQNAGGSAPYGIATDRDDWHRTYVVDSNSRVWRTTDAGSGWTEVTSNLGKLLIDTRTVAVLNRSATPGDVTILVGGLGGVVYAADTRSASSLLWNKLGNLPNGIVSDLHYDSADDILIAGTFGRGAWKMSSVRSFLFGICYSARCDPSIKWVDFSYTGTQTGCSDQPFNSLAGGIGAVPVGGGLAIESGSTPTTATISKAMRISACGGPVTIGH